MNKILISLFVLMFSTTYIQAQTNKFSLSDFYGDSPVLQKKVDSIYESLSPEQRIGQMIITSIGTLGKSESEVLASIAKNEVGGVILLGGDRPLFTSLYQKMQQVNKGLPLLYSLDAEPSLLPNKVKDIGKFKKTNQILDSLDCATTTQSIDSILEQLHVLHNYAPVCDLSPDNVVIGSRSFGSDPKRTIQLAGSFCAQSNLDGVLPTIKHFPGHGFVKGDSHKQLVYIDGEMRELGVFHQLMHQGIVSVMVGHIAVQNNPFSTEGLPSTCSRRIVTDLLRDSLGFKGIIITDAINMGALKMVENAPLKAVQAGCDLILMPVSESKLIADVLAETQKSRQMEIQVTESVKRVIKMKVCLGLIH